MTREKRVPLYQRLPEIYRIKDAEQQPPDQLRDYLALVEDAFGAIHENIEALYNDLFIETCDDWVIPYIGDLLGTSHLSGEVRTLRADVADTVALRRRKGTLGAIELLAYDLTGWGVHCVELRENLIWNQHLNHQRPDDGGLPPYRDSRPGDPNPNMKLQTVIRGGTATLRDPASSRCLIRPSILSRTRRTLGRLPTGASDTTCRTWRSFSGVWRPIACALPNPSSNRPRWQMTTSWITPNRRRLLHESFVSVSTQSTDRISPMKKREPVRLFNTNLVAIDDAKRRGVGSLDNSSVPPSISLIDETPGPIPTERLTSGAPAGFRQLMSPSTLTMSRSTA